MGVVGFRQLSGERNMGLSLLYCSAMDEHGHDHLLHQYFSMGFSNAEIGMCLLLHHGITLSDRTVKRRLSNLGLFRRKYYSDDVNIASFIEKQLEGAGRMHGYKWMHLKCLHNGKLFVSYFLQWILEV